MRQRGFTILEVTIALSVVAVLAGTAVGGIRAHQVSVVREWSRLAASRAASGHLEVLRDEHRELVAGTRTFRPTLEGGVGTETISEIESGLYEVTVDVRHTDTQVAVGLTTLIVREAAP